MTLISKHEGTASYEPATFDPDSKWLYYLPTTGRSSRACGATSSRRGKSEDVEKADWDVAWTFFSKNGKYRLSAVNQDGRKRPEESGTEDRRARSAAGVAAG